MAILRKSNKERYTTILQSITMDKRLSLKDLGLLVKLLSLPDNWNFSEKGLAKILEQDGQTSIRTAIKNLEEYGYLTRKRERDEAGKVTGVEWIITEEPTATKEVENPRLENHNLDNPNLETQPQYNTKEYNTKKINTNSFKERNAKERNTTKSQYGNLSYEIVEEKINNLNETEKVKDLIRQIMFVNRKNNNKPITSAVFSLFMQRLAQVSDGNEEIKIKKLEDAVLGGFNMIYLNANDVKNKPTYTKKQKETNSDKEWNKFMKEIQSEKINVDVISEKTAYEELPF